MLSSHLMWCIWDVVQASSEAHGLGFLENSLVRREEYDVHKGILFKILSKFAASEENTVIVEKLKGADENDWKGLLKELEGLHKEMSGRRSESIDWIRKHHSATHSSLKLK
eukprot:TRINITY_DN7142_c0_g1_i1.p1 TRINITY_DN7142_c0_g1~~TRINITY_DN7142_c0_g1_i1.p1  ORF type:complete len:111 (+),score=40.58 TRINITY_DN7142_c0_g1_i1:329-661(+)